MDNGSYRSDEDSLRARFISLQEQRERERGAALGLYHLYAARLARVVGGLAGVACMVWLIISAVLMRVGDFPPEIPGLSLLLTPPLILLLGWGTSAWTQKSALTQYSLYTAATGDLRADMARISEPPPQQDLPQRAARLERWSLAAPLLAASLLAPLLIHSVIVLCFVSGGASPSDTLYEAYGHALSGLTDWICLSLLIVGHCHLVLAFLGWRYTGELSRATTAELEVSAHKGWRALWITSAISLVPGLWLIGIPSAMVLVTGLLFIPAMFGWALRRLKAERLRLEEPLATAL